MNKLLMIWAAALFAGLIAIADHQTVADLIAVAHHQLSAKIIEIAHHQPAADLIAVATACAVAAIAWLIWHHVAFRRLRSLHTLPIAPPRLLRRRGGKVTAAEVRQMFRNQWGLCNNPYCRADLKRTSYEIDHIVAKSRGGRDGPDNAQLLCRDWNQMKCAQT